jgi:hypothetical protein
MGIFSNLFGNKSSDLVSSKIDNIINNLPIRQADKQFDNLVDGALNDIIDMTGDKTKDGAAKANLNQIEELLDGITIPEMRVRKYDTYDDIYKSVQLVKRIIKVYIANIFQKDPVSNTSLLLKETEIAKNFEKIGEIKQLMKNVIKFFKIDEKLKYNTAFNMLKYGDAFIEIVDLSEISTVFPTVTDNDIKAAAIALAKENSKDELIITECYQTINSKNEYIGKFDLDKFADVFFEFASDVDINDADKIIYEEVAADGADKSQDSLAAYNQKLQKLVLKFHKPHKIVPLVSPYDNILGYVELKEINKQTTSTNVLKQFTDIIDKVSNKTNPKEAKYDDVLRDLSKLIVKKILLQHGIVKPVTGKKFTNDEYEDLIQKSLGDEMFYNLKRTVIGLDHNSLFRKKLQVRFIKAQNCFWFRSPSSDYYPYGCSVIDPLVHPAKLYMFNQLANSIYKLSRASQIRKWTVDKSSCRDLAISHMKIL